MIDYEKLHDYIGEDTTDITATIKYISDGLRKEYGRLPTVKEFLSAVTGFREKMQEWRNT